MYLATNVESKVPASNLSQSKNRDRPLASLLTARQIKAHFLPKLSARWQ
jgi:hypothetical protein